MWVGSAEGAVSEVGARREAQTSVSRSRMHALTVLFTLDVLRPVMLGARALRQAEQYRDAA